MTRVLGLVLVIAVLAAGTWFAPRHTVNDGEKCWTCAVRQ